MQAALATSGLTAAASALDEAGGALTLTALGVGAGSPACWKLEASALAKALPVDSWVAIDAADAELATVNWTYTPPAESRRREDCVTLVIVTEAWLTPSVVATESTNAFSAAVVWNWATVTPLSVTAS